MRRLFLLIIGIVLLASASAAQAGTLSIAWDANTDSDLASYKVYWGTAVGVYPNSVNVGNVTSYTLTGLDPCTRYYVAVKAVDTGGLESAAYSNEVNGLPRPVVNTITPSSGEQGARLTLVIAGESFDTGATVTFTGTGITVTAVRRDSCTQLSVDVTIDIAATAGARDVTVMNPDRSFGTKASGFTVATNVAPTVAGVTPAAGATNVAITVKPTVTFSEAMDATTITSSTVKLLDSNGVAVTQAAGSPTLSADKLTATITPAASLANSKTYRVNVISGSSGVKDVNSKPLAADYTQTPGFTTAAPPDTTAPTVASTDPLDNATNVSVSYQPKVTFSEAMDVATITSGTVQLLDASGNAVAQAAGSPSLSADKLTATITPAAALTERSRYRIRVIGGSSGVKDLAGNALATTYTQPNGFQSENRPPAAPTGLHRTDTM